MVQTLKEYLVEHPPKGFHPTPHYFGQGDFVTYYFRNEPCYAERVDDLLTVYLAFETKELVGCKIDGVKQILGTARDFGIALDDREVRLGIFLFLGAALARDESQRNRYRQLGREAKEVAVDRKQLESVCP